MNHTQHSQHRQQQRNIPDILIELLCRFGATQYDHHHGLIRYFDKAARRKVEAYAGQQLYAVLERFLDIYAVFAVDDEAIITLGRRYKPIPH
jgi:hypothetical protein